MSQKPVHGVKQSRAYNIGWYIVTGFAFVGVISLWLTGDLYGWFLIIAGMVGVVSFALISSWQATKDSTMQPEGGRLTIPIGTTIFFLTLILAADIIPTEIDITFVGSLVLLVTGTQALFLAISVRREGMPFANRFVIPAVGHIILATGSILLIVAAFRIPDTRLFQGVLLWYATGLSALTLDAFWMGQRASEVTPPPPNSVSEYWEKLLLGAIIIGVSSLALVILTALQEPLTFEVASLGQPWAMETRLEQLAAIVVGISAVIGVATIAAPASAPEWLQQFDRTGLTISLHALAGIVLLNTLLLGLFFIFPTTFLISLGALLGLVTVVVVIDYLRIVYTYRRRYPDPPTEPASIAEMPPVTIVIPAYNEAAILSEMIERNLEELRGFSMLLVPAASSTDSTVEIAHDYQDSFPDRIRVFEGTTGSKAGDLNEAWNAIDTPFVLLLDADEIADFVSVSHALTRLQEAPDVGIVQARKVPRRPHGSWRTWFISSERRIATWINHQVVNDLFDAAHFAGSAALMRHDVPLDVDGWETQALTEDIDLTVRVNLETDWRIDYCSHLTVNNLPPATMLDLIRQRRRWARGWMEVTWRYTRDIIRSRHELGRPKTVGLLWELFSTVAAPFYLISPAVTVFVFVGLGPSVPTMVAIILAVFLLPARGIYFAYAAATDPIIPVRRNIFGILKIFVSAYLWILFLWIMQLHVLYLQLAGAPKQWEATAKEAIEGDVITDALQKEPVGRSVSERVDRSLKGSVGATVSVFGGATMLGIGSILFRQYTVGAVNQTILHLQYGITFFIIGALLLLWTQRRTRYGAWSTAGLTIAFVIGVSLPAHGLELSDIVVFSALGLMVFPVGILSYRGLGLSNIYAIGLVAILGIEMYLFGVYYCLSSYLETDELIFLPPVMILSVILLGLLWVLKREHEHSNL